MENIKRRIIKLLPQKKETKLFLFSFLFLVFTTILLTYNYEVDHNYNLLFDSDTARVIGDATEIGAEHYRLSVHPLFVLMTQPVVFLIKGIVLNKAIAISLLSALVSALSVLYLYRILEHINKGKKENIIISLLYLFSFSNIIFTSGIETYNFAALFLIMMWYYYVQKQDKYDIFSYIILIILGILSFAFTLTNCIIFLILLFLLWITKKIKTKNIIIIGIATLMGVVFLNVTQKVIWNNTPLIWKTNVAGEQKSFSEKQLSIRNIKNVVTDDYFNSMIGSNIRMGINYGTDYNGQNYIINFQNQNLINIIILTIFYIITIGMVIRNFQKQKYLNIGLLLSLGFNTALHLFYGNNGAFLYSLHFIYIIMLLLGVNLTTENNKKYKKYITYFLGLFLVYEFINNNIIFVKCLKLVKETLNNTYLIANFGFVKTTIIEALLIILVTIIVFGIREIYQQIKKEKKKEKKIVYSVLLFVLVIGIESIFISLESAPFNHKWLLFHTQGLSGEVAAKSKSEYLDESFKKAFKEELKELDHYKKEYKEFIEEYKPELSNRTNWSDYYYLGLGNRKKYLYRNNRIIDIETKKEIIHFQEKEHMIIPNLYTVVIETKSGDKIKIKEDEEGVHYIVNGKDKILDGTNKKIELYDFSNQKYSNIKKVLYGEILFNIKDSVIYPNIIVYDKPWYRDAALACMVLKKTNNLDLIKDWVNNITEIYDKQNDGVEEADNLGELLYILSTQDEKNEELIQKIEDEAERIANENEDGYYIKGKTDFGDMYLYQNLWYKLGIESVGKDFHFDIDSVAEDGYTNMAWWSDYEVKDKDAIESLEYPYLSYATRHKLGFGKITMNQSLYPLSWEINASQAKYDNYEGLDTEMQIGKISPLHTWSASELLLWILEETEE